MPTIGITGGLASGKSTVAQAFADLGAEVINADQIVHELIDRNGPCVESIRLAFGDEVVQDGQVKRQELARLVFGEPEKLAALERIIHPEVRRVMQERINTIQASDPSRFIVLDVPLLFEAKMDDLVDVTIAVTSTEELQIERACAALKITKQDALLRIQSQMPLAEKAAKADFVIDNTGNKFELINEVKLIWQKVQPTAGR